MVPSQRAVRFLSGSALLLLLVNEPALAAEAAVPETDAQPQTVDGWTPELQMRFRQVQATAIADDGSRVAFVVREPVMEGEKSEYRSQLWVAAPGEGGARQMTWRDESSTAPAFSPDGRWLAFLSEKASSGAANKGDGDGPKTQIWVMPVDGGEGREVSTAANGVRAFAWSPTGDRVAYVSTEPESAEDKKAKKEKRYVEVLDQDFALARLWVAPFDPSSMAFGEAKQLGNESAVHVTGLGWAPDGERIVISHQADPRLNTGTIASDLSLVDASSGERTPLVSWEGVDQEPHFSPDGKQIAFVSNGGSVERVGLGDVYVVDAGGGAPRTLGHTPDRHASIVGWTDDGELLISEAWHTERGLFLLPTDGSEARRVDGGGVLGLPSLATRSDAVAFTYEDASTPENVFFAHLSSFLPSQLSDLHAGIDVPPMGRTEKVTWRSDDGTEIEGLLTYPVGYVAGERVPLVLDIHGGPSGVFIESFTGAPSNYMLQTFAQQGYAILRPNPRGSTGYGKEFRYANVRDWCMGDYNDVMRGVDAVIERGVADPERLFVMGWSYGGYMTSCVVSRTDRFRAASMGAGLPNLVSMVHTTDVPDYLVAHLGGKELWEDYEGYMQHSAMFKLEKITTPTQILHGENDLRVPFTQGQEFYTALTRKGVPTEMAVYPRTPHGPREPKLVMDVTPRILAWFERFMPAK